MINYKSLKEMSEAVSGNTNSLDAGKVLRESANHISEFVNYICSSQKNSYIHLKYLTSKLVQLYPPATDQLATIDVICGAMVAIKILNCFVDLDILKRKYLLINNKGEIEKDFDSFPKDCKDDWNDKNLVPVWEKIV